MSPYRKKIIVFGLAVAMDGLALLTASAQPPKAAPCPETSQSKAEGWSAKTPKLPAGSAESFDTKKMFYKMTFAVLVVLALGAAVIYASKKLLPAITNLSGKEIRIIETVHLGPRRTVHLLKVGNRRFLIGSTTENITNLADLSDDFADVLANLSAKQPDNL